ncbi:MAG: hypothetical protein AB8G95_07590 [Anaerolineae bacterium]
MLRGLPNRIQFIGMVCFAILVIGVSALSVSAQTNVPTISIDAVSRNETVTVSGANFPANQSFTVTMGPYGGYGINGATSATTVNSGTGSFTADIAIPAGVKDYGVIAIRLEGAGYNSYNWFYNNSTSVSTSAGEEARGAGESSKEEEVADVQVYTGVPALTFEKVEGEQVTVRTGNFPPNQTFSVSMGSYGTAGVGPSVGTIASGDGADTSHTFTIPTRIAHYGYILVRAQTGHSNPFYATAGFNNPSDPVAEKDPDKDTTTDKLPDKVDTKQVLWLGNPSLTTCVVDSGKTVTIVANNLPTNLDYTVRMNAFGTLGLNGESVGTLSPGDNSATRQEFKIPASLAGHNVIAIRVDAGIYHAYGYFYNNTAAVC